MRGPGDANLTLLRLFRIVMSQHSRLAGWGLSADTKGHIAVRLHPACFVALFVNATRHGVLGAAWLGLFALALRSAQTGIAAAPSIDGIVFRIRQGLGRNGSACGYFFHSRVYTLQFLTLGAAMEEASNRFPFINLEKALERARQLFDADKSGKPMLVTVAFELWDYGLKSSGAFQTVAALKAYGLLDDDGANADRRVRLTDAARRYFLDERDDVRAGMLSEFALTPPFLRYLWTTERWSEGVPADTVARSYLKIDRHLNEQSARALLGIFKDNARFAGLKSSVSAAASVGLKAPSPPPEPEAELGKGLITREGANALSSPPTRPEAAVFGQTLPQASSPKPIVFDMDSVTVSGRFFYVEDLRDFIVKLQRLEPLMPSKEQPGSS